MPAPYNITQVDIPGVYAAAQSARMGRIQQMLMERQVQAADRQADRDNAIRSIIARAYSSPPSAPSGDGAATQPATPPMPLAAATGAAPAVTPHGLPGPDPAPVGVQQLDPNIARQLVAADPEHGPALVHSLMQMDEAQRSQAMQRLQALGPLYVQAAHLPYEQRRAFIQSVIPQLQQLGIDPQQAAGFDPTDQNLNAHMAFGMTMEQALASTRGHPMNVAPGNVTIDTDTIDPATGQPRVIYQSPFVPGPNGEVYPRPQSMDAALPRPRSPVEAARLAPGTRFLDPNGVVRTVPGGPASAPGNFPRQDGGAFDFSQHP